MDLFGPTSIRSIDHKYYSLVVTDDLSRFSWVFFLGTKDETYYILKDFITFIEKQLNKKVKAIRCDNGTEFKNSNLIELRGSKWIKRDYSNARTPQQNRVGERKNRTLIEAARTMLADSKLPTMFWTEAISTACYVLNRVLATRPHNKTPYELLSGKVPNISHLKPFGCHVIILNTSDHLGKFEGKADEGFIVGYVAHNKAYRGLGQEWYFDLDYLTDSLGYTRFKSNQPAGTQDTHIHAGTQDDSDSECDEQVIVVPSFPSNRFSGPKVHEASEMVESNSDYAEELARLQRQEHEAKDTAEKYGFGFSKDTEEHLRQADMVPAGSIDPAASISAGPAEPFPTVIKHVHADETSLPPGHSLGSSEHSTRFPSPSDLANSISSSSEMEDIYHHPSTGIFSSSSYDADFGGTVTNLAPIVAVDPVPTKRVNTIHPQSQILGDLTSPVQTRGTLKKSKFGESTFVSYVHDQQRNNHTDYLHCLFACFLSQLEPISVAQALNDSDWVEILKNKRDARGIVVRNKAKLVAQGHRQEEGINYDECKKQTIMATSSTEAEYVAAANCCGQCGLLLMIKNSFWYALTHDPIIFDSLVKQFWSTASLRAPELGSPAILATMIGLPTLSLKTLKLFTNMRLNFEGDYMPLLVAMLPPAQAAIADEGTGEAALDVPQTIPETIQETRPDPDQSQEHIPTPPRPTTSDQIPPVFEQGHISDPNIASFLGAHESDPDLFTSTNVEDETLGGSFHTTPLRSTQVTPEGLTSGGTEDLVTLTALSSLVSELVQKVSTLESELTAHKLLFKEVVGKLVKKVKALELKLKTRSRKVVMSESDKEEEEEQDVDPLIKLAKAAAALDAHVDVSLG
ncbi:putative ribonuclease H-like domain-containing protein, partial [Tanacetum coccineum]